MTSTEESKSWRAGSGGVRRGSPWNNQRGKGRDHGRKSRAERKQEKNDTIVLKNLPRSLESSELIERLNSYDVKPDTLMYHYDAQDNFSGIAMVKYDSVEDAVQMHETLQGIDIGGRTIRVEYKFQRLEETEEYQSYYEQIKAFREGEEPELLFDSSLTPFQRKQVHQIAERLHLLHESIGDGASRCILVKRQARRGSSFPRREDSPSLRKLVEKKEPQIRPIRQPKGPDGTLGFSKEYQDTRRKELKARGLLLRVSVTDANGEPVDLTEI